MGGDQENAREGARPFAAACGRGKGFGTGAFFGRKLKSGAL